MNNFSYNNKIDNNYNNIILLNDKIKKNNNVALKTNKSNNDKIYINIKCNNSKYKTNINNKGE